MSAYEVVQQWLKECRPALFPPLDDDGHSLVTMPPDTVIRLYVDPLGDDEEPLCLEMLLLSLAGTDDGQKLSFLWELAESNATGILPTGYRLHADRDDLGVRLGAQFAVQGMDALSFSRALENFSRFGAEERSRLASVLTSKASAPVRAAAQSSIPNIPNMPLIQV